MTDDQKQDFQKRRMNVVRQHIKNDPKIRAARRKRKRSLFGSVLGGVVAFAVAMLLLKSFVLALHGPRDYAQIVAPVLEGAQPDSITARLFGPDPVSTEIAALLQPILLRRVNIAATQPAVPATDPAQDPDRDI